ncbi:hypothetical protein [Duganella vulcania]|uniref:Uncharacterized protein n=1 Tax=Duganella vulcania TaxID=2692166 RepID=A0A845GGX0_9BURK|nr:hypothetical protein [Duganella vulcania]MYM92516.1 hypothetical protein [Duganella vulcania]
MWVLHFAALIFESLTCLPFALNLTRHISLTTQPDADFLSIARCLLPGQAWRMALNKVIVRVAALGPELGELCERKTKEINSAYDQAMAERSTT